MAKVDINDAIHEKFMEFVNLGIIKYYDQSENLLYIDRDKLAKILGYTIAVDVGDFMCSQPVFRKLSDINYSINPTLYLSDVVPFEALHTYVLNEIRDSIISF